MTTLLARLHALIVWVVLSPVYFYRRVLSPLKGRPTCRFLPTCSEYAIEAVQVHGVVVGGAKAAYRVLRCNPLCRGGFDPVCRHHAEEHA